MSLVGLGRVKTKSDLVVVPSGRQIFAFFCSPHDHRAQNSGCGYTALSFYTARVKSGKAQNEQILSALPPKAEPSDLPDFNEYTPVKKLNACSQT